MAYPKAVYDENGVSALVRDEIEEAAAEGRGFGPHPSERKPEAKQEETKKEELPPPAEPIAEPVSEPVAPEPVELLSSDPGPIKPPVKKKAN